MPKHTQQQESQQKQEHKHIPALAFLLAVPAGLLSSAYIQASSADIAILNQKVVELFPTAYANTINFNGDGEWTDKDGSYSVTDHSNHSNHSNHANNGDGGDGGGGSAGADGDGGGGGGSDDGSY